MRIGLVCPYDLSKPGGVQAQVMGLASALRLLGEDVSIVGPGLPTGVEGVDLLLEVEDGVEIAGRRSDRFRIAFQRATVALVEGGDALVVGVSQRGSECPGVLGDEGAGLFASLG